MKKMNENIHVLFIQFIKIKAGSGAPRPGKNLQPLLQYNDTDSENARKPELMSQSLTPESLLQRKMRRCVAVFALILMSFFLLFVQLLLL